MLFIIFIMFFMFMIGMMLLMMNFMFYFKLLKNREKMSPFECGFDPMSKSRMPFSIQFFLISLIFLIFDIEITLLVPLVYLTNTYSKMCILLSFLFLIILIMGLLIEYLEKSIDWKT